MHTRGEELVQGPRLHVQGVGRRFALGSRLRKSLKWLEFGEDTTTVRAATSGGDPPVLLVLVGSTMYTVEPSQRSGSDYGRKSTRLIPQERQGDSPPSPQGFSDFSV